MTGLVPSKGSATVVKLTPLSRVDHGQRCPVDGRQLISRLGGKCVIGFQEPNLQKAAIGLLTSMLPLSTQFKPFLDLCVKDSYCRKPPFEGG